MTTASATEPTIGVFYEHPEWFEPMFAELDRRGVRYDRLLAHEHCFDPTERSSPYALVLNRMSPSAFRRGHARAIPYTLEYLAHLEAVGADVLNGYRAYRYEFSKTRQLGMLSRLGVRAPRARVVQHAGQAVGAARALRYPLVIKPNVGGSGAGIRRFDDEAELRDAVEEGDLALGLDGVALMQEYHRPAGGRITRVEVLGGRLLYAIELRLESPDSFDLCPADYCRVPAEGTPDGTAAVEPLARGVTPPRHVVETVLRIAEAAGMEVGGVEYLVSERDGATYYYDVNALSNFVANAPDVVGFDPFTTLVDFVLERAGLLRYGRG
ncbi:MAG TPA: hypothetical protein VKA00_07000 [Trueperaceae bacterium]|nr:hypothetical protein [Trueperaceae bacterium]